MDFFKVHDQEDDYVTPPPYAGGHTTELPEDLDILQTNREERFWIFPNVNRLASLRARKCRSRGVDLNPAIPQMRPYAAEPLKGLMDLPTADLDCQARGIGKRALGVQC